MLSVGDDNNGTAHRDVDASRCLARADLHSLEEMISVLCLAEFFSKKKQLRHLGVIYADVFEWVEFRFRSSEPHFVLQYHATDVDVRC